MTITRRAIGAMLLATTSLAAPAMAQDFEQLRQLRLERSAESAARQAPPRVRHVERDVEPKAERPVRRAQPKPVAPRPAPAWAATAGSDLQTTLQGWSERAGWKLLWQSDFVYDLNSGTTFQGSFEDSVKALILAMRDVRPTPTVVFYGGNRTLVVKNDGRGQTD